MSVLIDYSIVILFGGLIGYTELVSRYRDAPFKAINCIPAWIYIIVNSLASVSALLIFRLININFGLDSDPELVRWSQVVVAGLSAMAFFRSSILVYRVGDQDVSVGPGSLLQIILSALDREVDRRRARDRASKVKELMEGVSFSKAQDPLPVIAFALMQNLPREEQDKVLNKIVQLSQNDKMLDGHKSYALGLALMDIIGPNVLESTVKMIGEDIKGVEEALDLDLETAEKNLVERIKSLFPEFHELQEDETKPSNEGNSK